MKTLICGLCMSMLMAMSAVAETTDVIGHIQTLKGSATVQRREALLPAAIGVPLQHGDVIRTGTPGAVGIVLNDDTTIALGPDSEFELKDYAFDPRQGNFACVMRIVKGSLVYLSGLIGKLAPQTIQVQTPDATIAVRGTKMLIEVKG
jgi:hypothetical protein